MRKMAHIAGAVALSLMLSAEGAGARGGGPMYSSGAPSGGGGGRASSGFAPSRGALSPGVGAAHGNGAFYRSAPGGGGGSRPAHGYRPGGYAAPGWPYEEPYAAQCAYTSDPCLQCVPVYDQWGNEVGAQLQNVCQ